MCRTHGQLVEGLDTFESGLPWALLTDPSALCSQRACPSRVPLVHENVANRNPSTLLIFSGVFTFLVDAYPLYAASALAANVFARCSFAGTFQRFMLRLIFALRSFQSARACAA